MPALLWLEVVDLDGGLLWWRGEAACDTLLHARHQDAVPELLPTLLGVVDRHDRPATRRRAGRVEDLALRQAISAGMHRRERRLVLFLRTARKVMHDPVRHGFLLSG